jgi:hypothetical protein
MFIFKISEVGICAVKCSRAIENLRCHLLLMTDAEAVSETSGLHSTMKRMVLGREHLIAFCLREHLKSH